MLISIPTLGAGAKEIFYVTMGTKASFFSCYIHYSFFCLQGCLTLSEVWQTVS